MDNKLREKYDIPAPRYTSYPTVPYWDKTPELSEWQESIKHSLKEDGSSWSLYIHIPFCEALCTFCGCNTTITRNHDVEEDYVRHVLKEWDQYIQRIPELKEKRLRQVHLGGGTPTFLSPENLELMMSSILKSCSYDSQKWEASLEVDPRRTTRKQLQVLADIGFNRISLGVQDFNEKVQDMINRIQSFELTEKITTDARELGYDSVNFDLIYGLPLQGPDEIAKTTDLTIKLKPDRIALYSLAIVPWIKPAQKKFTNDQLASGEEKRKLYEIAREKLLKAGYEEIGMDHFALPNDDLFKSLEKRTIHRNFMGYTCYETDVLLGLGVSSISESKTCFHQNEKVLNVYKESVSQGNIPTFRGHKHTSEDLFYRKLILKLMTTWQLDVPCSIQDEITPKLAPLLEDELITYHAGELSITKKGRPFIRNICMVFDKRMFDKKPQTQIFSQSL